MEDLELVIKTLLQHYNDKTGRRVMQIEVVWGSDEVEWVYLKTLKDFNTQHLST